MNQEPNSVIFFRNDNGILCYSFNDKVYKINLQGDSFKVNQKISTVIDNTGLISFIKTADGIPTFIYKPKSQQSFIKGGGGGGGVLAFIGGGGDNNFIAKFSPDGTHLADSLLYDNGTSIGYGTVTPAANATFDINSTTQGILFPRMTTVQRNAIAAPTDGLFVYNTTTKLFSYWDSNAGTWQNIDSQAGGDVSGSGTTNFVMKWTDGPNSVAGDSQIIDDGTNVGIGINPANSKLQVAGAIRTGVASTTNGSLIFQNSTNANTTTINAGVFGANITWTLPTAQGGASSVLTNDGTGILSWGSAVTADWQLNGNTVGSEKWIGTIDNFDFPIRTNNTEVSRFYSGGRKTFTGSANLQVDMLASGDVRIGNAANTGIYWKISQANVGINIDAPPTNSTLYIQSSGSNQTCTINTDAAHTTGFRIENAGVFAGGIFRNGPDSFIMITNSSDENIFKIYNTTNNVVLCENAGTVGNVGIGTSTFGTSATLTLGIQNGVVPTTSPANMIQIFSVDTDDATASLGLRTEQAVVTETVVSDRTLKATINGTLYKICLKA